MPMASGSNPLLSDCCVAGGQLSLHLTGHNIDTAFVAQTDDIATVSTTWDDCIGATNDCFAWDPSIQEGTFFWLWDSCCTDGLVFGMSAICVELCGVEL